MFACKLCERNFVDEEALKKHQAQKHTGRKAAPDSLKPDWFKGKGDAGEEEEGADDEGGLGRCEVCGVAYRENFSREDHEREFVLDNGVVDKKYRCSCGKDFREERSLIQHQNICSNCVL